MIDLGKWRESSCWEVSGEAGRVEDPALGFGVSKFPKSPSSSKSCFVPVSQRGKICLLLGNIEPDR